MVTGFVPVTFVVTAFIAKRKLDLLSANEKRFCLNSNSENEICNKTDIAR